MTVVGETLLFFNLFAVLAWWLMSKCDDDLQPFVVVVVVAGPCHWITTTWRLSV